MKIVRENSIVRSELKMRSYKPGNIIINAHADWKKVAAFILSSCDFIASVGTLQPFQMVIGLLLSLISASDLAEIKLAENATAIIMALQMNSIHNAYTTTEHRCKNDANQILITNGYEKMDEKIFQDEISYLIAYKCVEAQNGHLKLLEKVSLQY